MIERFLFADHVYSLWSSLYFPGSFSSPNSKIWILWRGNFSITLASETDQLLYLRITHLFRPDPIFVTAVYAKSTKYERRVLWEDILSLSNSVGTLPSMIAGDFNAICSLDEYSGPSTPDMGSIAELAAFILAGGFVALPTTGGFLTWSGVPLAGRVRKKVDRFLFSSDWRHHFFSGSIELLNRTTSDHSPMLYTVPFIATSSLRPFRFQPIWTKRSDFPTLIATNWDELLQAYGMHRFSLKL